MSELLSCIGKGQSDLEMGLSQESRNMEVLSSKHVVIFAAHAASIALIFCEERADDILTKVENGCYKDPMKEWCRTIRVGAELILKKEVML